MSIPSDITIFNAKYKAYLNAGSPSCIGNASPLVCQNLDDAYKKIQTDSGLAETNSYVAAYQTNLQLRADLKQKVMELQKTPDTVYADVKASYDSAIYINILGTVIVTSFIYYIFIKLE
jgi:hypothetical protein